MSLKKTILLVLFITLLTTLVMLLRSTSVYANISDYLNATVKVSICGNDIIEGGEDCEKDNLNNQTCQSIGFGPGTLSCDIACTFDTYGCGPTPTSTPTPIPTVTPTPIITLTPTLTSEDNSDDQKSTETTISEKIQSTPTPEITPKPSLPSFLTSFDPNNDGILFIQELFSVTKQWVDGWKEALTENIILDNKSLAQKKDRECDLNSDYRCNLQDFSILMSYIKQ